MKKSLIRFEPYINAFLAMYEGKLYKIPPEKIDYVLSDLPCYQVTKNTKHPPGEYSAPETVQIQMTKVCNLRCVTCAVANEKVDHNLSFADILLLLEALSQFGVLRVEWSGGEPMMDKKFVELVEFSARMGFEQSLLTNGTLFNERNIAVIKNNFSQIQVSLDGVGDVYNRIVGLNAWGKFVNSLTFAIDRDVNNLTTATVLQKDNVSSIENIIDFCIESGVERHRISLQVPIGRSSMLSWSDYSKVIDQFRLKWPAIKERAQKNGLIIDCFLEKEECNDSSVEDVGDIISSGGHNFLYVDNGGNVYPFPFLTQKGLKLGEISDNIREIWLGSKALNHLRQQNYKNTGCGNCRLECAFAERSLVYAFTGKLNGAALVHNECSKRR